MTTRTADPYVIRLPEKITNPDGSPSNEFSQWLNYDNRWKQDIWIYTGGGENIIGENIEQVETNSLNIEINATNITNLNSNLTALTGRVTANEADILELQEDNFLTYVEISSSATASAGTWNNVTAQCVVTLPASPENNDRVVIHKNTGSSGDYVDVTDGVGTNRIITDQAVISYRYSSDMSDWVVGA